MRLVHVRQRAVREHNLIVDHAVGSPADFVAVEVDTTSQEQAGDTNGADAAAGDGEAVGFEVFVDVGPAVAY